MNLKTRLALATLALTLCAFAKGGEEKVLPLEEVPTEHREVARNLFPEATFSRADTETDENGTIVYEIQGRTPDGRRVEVDLFENGDVEEYEVEFNEAQMPGAVTSALRKKLPGFSPTYIEASHSPSGKVMRYELEGTLGGEELDIEVSADGRKIEVADQ